MCPFQADECVEESHRLFQTRNAPQKKPARTSRAGREFKKKDGIASAAISGVHRTRNSVPFFLRDWFETVLGSAGQRNMPSTLNRMHDRRARKACKRASMHKAIMLIDTYAENARQAPRTGRVLPARSKLRRRRMPAAGSGHAGNTSLMHLRSAAESRGGARRAVRR